MLLPHSLYGLLHFTLSFSKKPLEMSNFLQSQWWDEVLLAVIRLLLAVVDEPHVLGEFLVKHHPDNNTPTFCQDNLAHFGEGFFGGIQFFARLAQCSHSAWNSLSGHWRKMATGLSQRSQ
jgi:hypothetical protein